MDRSARWSPRSPLVARRSVAAVPESAARGAGADVGAAEARGIIGQVAGYIRPSRVEGPERGGTPVSWLPSKSRAVKAVRAAISGGTEVMALSDRYSCSKPVRAPISVGSPVSRLFDAGRYVIFARAPISVGSDARAL